MSTIQHLNSAIDYHWKDLSRQFPAFERPQIVPAASIRKNAPLYMQSVIDQDPDSYYIFVQAVPGKGDVSRDAAMQFFDELFYNRLHMPSSFDVEAGGDLSRPEAIDREVLPPAGDRRFQSYYDEQMAKLDAQAQAARRKAADDEFERKNGFRRDDPDIIDIDVDGGNSGSASTTAVGAAASTAVGAPKQIWYAVDVHVPAGGMLGYNRGSNRLNGRRGARGYLSEKDETEMVGEALNGGASITQLLDDLLAAVGKNTPIWNDLMDIKDKYNLETVTVGLEESNISWGVRGAIKDLRTAIDRIANGGIVFDGFKEEADALFDKYFGEWNMNESKKLGESVPFSQEDADDIADMFAGYSAGSLSGAGRSQLMGFMQMHGDELKKMASQASQSGGFGDFSRARDLGNDDLDESKAETASEIDEIIGEDDDRSDTEKGISEYEKVEDDVDEDDDELSESVIRHATMLAREIW